MARSRRQLFRLFLAAVRLARCSSASPIGVRGHRTGGDIADELTAKGASLSLDRIPKARA